MEIGTKLKNARAKCGLTQEKVAEELGVSRQSVSNWENSRSYPDIASVIKLSDLYSVSLDELLKEDTRMIEHLGEATNTVRSRRRLTWLVMAGVYLLIWTAAILLLYVVTAATDAAPDAYTEAYVVGAFYLILPSVSAVLSAVTGYLTERWRKWIFPAVFGAMEAAAFIAAGMMASDDARRTTLKAFLGSILRYVFRAFTFKAFAFTLIVCAAAMGIGSLIHHLKYTKKRRGSGIPENDKNPGREEDQL